MLSLPSKIEPRHKPESQYSENKRSVFPKESTETAPPHPLRLLWAHANRPRCCATSLPNREQDYSDLGLRGNRRERVVREIEHGSPFGGFIDW